MERKEHLQWEALSSLLTPLSLSLHQVLGHESAGIVTAVGPEVKTHKVGDRVALEPGVPCFTCRACKSGTYNHCPDLIFAATPPYDGSLASKFLSDTKTRVASFLFLKVGHAWSFYLHSIFFLSQHTITFTPVLLTRSQTQWPWKRLVWWNLLELQSMLLLREVRSGLWRMSSWVLLERGRLIKPGSF